MSQEAVEKFLGRLLTDDGFRTRAARAAAKAAREEGYQLSDYELRAVSGLDFLIINEAARRIDSSIKRFSPSAPGSAASEVDSRPARGKKGSRHENV
jgi:hypothetical protein